MVERPALNANISELKSLYAGSMIALTITCEMKGSGIAGVAPEIGSLLRACGCSETVVSGVSVTYAPAAVTGATGINWVRISNPRNTSLFGVASNGSQWVAVGGPDGTDAYLITSSDNGASWIERSNPKNVSLFDVVWAGSVWIAVGDYFPPNAYLVTSPDGVTWTQQTHPLSVNVNGVDWNGSIAVAVGSNGYIITSSDGGVTWTQQTSPKARTLNAVTWNSTLSLWVAVGNIDVTDSFLITSPDGTTWTERSHPKNIQLNDVASSPSGFVAVGNADGTDSYILHSLNGINWYEQINPRNIALNSVKWNGSKFVAVGNADGTDGYIISSSDGKVWAEESNPLNRALFDVSANDSIFVAVGQAVITPPLYAYLLIGTPFSTGGHESATLYLYQDGTRIKITGCRGSAQFTIAAGGKPMVTFQMIGHTYERGTASAGAASTITLQSNHAAVDNIYNGQRIKIIQGTGAGQERIISSYVGATKIATVSVAWTTVPDATSVYGIENGPMDIAVPAPTYDSTVPAPVAGLGFNVDGYGPVIESLIVDQGNAISHPASMNSPDGYADALIVGRDCGGSFNPEHQLIATHDFIDRFRKGTAMALNTGAIGGTAGNIIRLTMPAISYREAAPGDRDGVRTLELTYGAAESAGDDEFSLIFT